MLDTSRQIKTSQHSYSFNYNSIAQLLLRPCFGDHYPGKESNRWLKLVTLVEGCTPTGVTPTVQSGAKQCKVQSGNWHRLAKPFLAELVSLHPPPPTPPALQFSSGYLTLIMPVCSWWEEGRLIFSNEGTVVWMEGPSVDKFMSPCPCAGCRFYIFNGSI